MVRNSTAGGRGRCGNRGAARYRGDVIRTDVLPASRISGPEPGMLFGGLFVLGSAYALPLFWNQGWSPIPPCIFHQVTGQPCPMCGATRSVVALAHGDIARSVYLYPLAPLLFLGMLIGISDGACAMVIGRRVRVTLSLQGHQRIGLIRPGLVAPNWL